MTLQRLRIYCEQSFVDYVDRSFLCCERSMNGDYYNLDEYTRMIVEIQLLRVLIYRSGLERR